MITIKIVGNFDHSFKKTFKTPDKFSGHEEAVNQAMKWLSSDGIQIAKDTDDRLADSKKAHDTLSEKLDTDLSKMKQAEKDALLKQFMAKELTS